MMSKKDRLDQLRQDWERHVTAREGKYDRYFLVENSSRGIDVYIHVDGIPGSMLFGGKESLATLRAEFVRILRTAIDGASQNAKVLVDSLYEEALKAAREAAIKEAQATLIELAQRPEFQCRHGVLDDDGSPSAEAHRDSCEDANAD